MELNVAVIGPAHALKGEVRLEIRTSDPQGRLAVGNILPTRPAANGPLTVERLRYDGRYYFAKFVEVNDRTRACLLYTSPSPRDGATSRMPSSA